MLIIGLDYHPEFQQIAFIDDETECDRLCRPDRLWPNVPRAAASARIPDQPVRGGEARSPTKRRASHDLAFL